MLTFIVTLGRVVDVRVVDGAGPAATAKMISLVFAPSFSSSFPTLAFSSAFLPHGSELVKKLQATRIQKASYIVACWDGLGDAHRMERNVGFKRVRYVQPLNMYQGSPRQTVSYYELTNMSAANATKGS